MPEQKVDIAQQIERLIKLQEIDSVIYRLKAEREQKPEEMQELNQQIEQEQKIIEDAKKSLKELQAKRQEKEVELETKESNIKKLNTQLYQLKTNKEYEAMQLEINGFKADCSVLEEDIIKLMDVIEEEKSKIADKQKVFEQKKQQITSQIKKIEYEIKFIEGELIKEEEKRKQASGEIDSKILSNYEKILKAKDGLALVPVVNNACGGCYMQLPPQVINEIRLKNEIIYCQMCSRILYDRGE